MEDDKLRAVLREWQAPAPGAAMDARVRDAWRAQHPTFWQRIWTTRIAVPVPVFAVVLLLAAAFFAIQYRAPQSAADAPSGAPSSAPGGTGRYLTRLDANGFQPVPNGDARIITVKEAAK